MTLVDNRIHAIDQTVVSFSRDDTMNTEIFASDGRMLYAVTTNAQTRMRTVVSRAAAGAGQDTRELIAVLHRRDWGPDKIRFAGENVEKMSAWLRGAGGKWSDL